MSSVVRVFTSAVLCSAIALSGCGDSSGDTDGGADSGARDATRLDTGVPPSDGGTDVGFGDAGDTGVGSDTGVDAGNSDGGVPGSEAWAAGVSVVFGEGPVRVRSGNTPGDTFLAVKNVLGQPTRKTPGQGSRSYEWDRANGALVTIWFNNTGVDANPIETVEDSDEVLWIALSGGFAGKDASGIGIGSTKTEVEAGYGAGRETAIPDPAGTLASYIRTGVLFAYEAGTNQVRTITVTRAYRVEPDGIIDLLNRRLQFGSGNIDLASGGQIPLGGDDQGDVEGVLGPPDASGDVTFGNTTLETYAYSFIGFEIFFSPLDSVLFISFHTPYYGTTPTPNAHGIGADRATFESYLTGTLNLAAGVPSNTSAELICYTGNNNAVGATYSAGPPETVSSIVLGLPLSACP